MRTQTAETAVTAGAAASVPPGPAIEQIPAGSAPTAQPPAPRALEWVDAATLTAAAPATDTVIVLPAPDLLADAPRRSPARPSVIIPFLLLAVLIAAYSATTLLWPLHAVPPQISAMQVQPVAAPEAQPAWPGQGSAAIRVGGITGDLASAPDAVPIASITKVVTALLVLDEMPLAVGEQGPNYFFTSADSASYWSYLSNNESALDVPVGGTLSEYQLLEGMLIGSANNYADRLAGNLWPNDAVYASAANDWLAAHGLTDIYIVDPSGIDYGNVATPDALLDLAQRALANPVIAEIVAKPSVELPGAGLVQNTNGLLADAGVIGVKTGSLDTYNLLSAKDVTVGDTTVRLYASVMGQPDDATRVAATRDLFTRLEEELQPRPSVTAGTVAGQVTTPWGQTVDVVAASDASVVLWNGGVADVQVNFTLGDQREKGDAVGSLSASGPLDADTVELQLAGDIEDPSPWWRLTHPLELFGLMD